MAHIAANLEDNTESKEFAALLDDSLQQSKSFEGSVVKGKIVDVDDDVVIVDVGLKSEGRISIREFSTPGQEPEIKTGDEVEVYVERPDRSLP